MPHRLGSHHNPGVQPHHAGVRTSVGTGATAAGVRTGATAAGAAAQPHATGAPARPSAVATSARAPGPTGAPTPASAAVGAAAASPLRRGADYALVHAGRSLRFGPLAFWAVALTLAIMAAWTLSTATYFAFREEVLTRLIARQAAMQFAYEDRIAELRAQVDRISSRQLLDQEQYEQKLDQVLRRQSALEQRASILNGLPDLSATGAVRQSPARNGGAGIEPRGPQKPSPLSDSHPPAAPDKNAWLGFGGKPSPRASGVDGALARLHASLDRVDAGQRAALASLEEVYDAKVRKLRGVLADVGIKPGHALPPGPGATGGPYVPPPEASDENAFERALTRITIARAHVERLTKTLAAMPVRRPVLGEVDLSSGFGTRMDPFTHAPAMHTGLDFRGDTGEPIRATAKGSVTVAGWNGGYGRMVEVDHGNGLATRYGHLSAIDVQVGQEVKIGQILGRIGSTGRSTGPHLHYETLVEGRTVDPQRFLRAGTKLGGN